MVLDQFSVQEIIEAISNSTDKNEKKILQALLLVKEGFSQAKVASDFLVNRSTVYRWMKRANEEGLGNLKCKKGRGRKYLLTEQQFSELYNAMSNPIITEDGHSRAWKAKDAVQFVNENFGVVYSESRMREIIKAVNPLKFLASRVQKVRV